MRQFRITDDSEWYPKYGLARAGDLTDSTRTFAPTRTTAHGSLGSKVLTVTSTSGFSAGDYVWICQEQQLSMVENYELNIVESVGSGVLNLVLPLTRAFSYSAVSLDKAQVIKVDDLGNYNLPAGQTLTAPAWTGVLDGTIILMGNGVCTIDGTIDLRDAGFRGGNTDGTGVGHAYCGEGTEIIYGSTFVTTPTGNSGGGGDGGFQVGGGAAALFTNGGNDQLGRSKGGVAIAKTDFTMMVLAGGGGAWIENPGSRGNGGRGPGKLILIFRKIVFSSTAQILLSSTAAPSPGWGGGGRSTGGMFLCKAEEIVIDSNNIAAQGGVGGNGTVADGGTAPDGAIQFEYGKSLTGTGVTTPTYTSRQDNTLLLNSGSVVSFLL